jgi:DNA-binding protein YbaB
VVALSGSKRTESLWIRTRVFAPGGDEVLATMLLNAAYMKDSFPNYAQEQQQKSG